MNREAPLITKALTLVSFALIITTVTVVTTAGYSAYQEYNALSGISNSQSNVTESFNGTAVSLNGLYIPNNMTYPLSLEILGSAYIANTHIGDFASPQQVIPPGKSATLSFGFNVDLATILQSSSLLQTVLFKSFDLELNATISASVVPLIGLNFSKSLNQVYPPLMGNLTTSFEVNKATMSSDNKSILVPLLLSWNDLAPIPLSGSVNATITEIPGQTFGNYGNGTGPFNVVQGQNQDIVTLAIPRSGPLANEIISGNYHGTYSFDLVLSTFGATVPLSENVTV
ncbi:MAG TPA: hypothetical protein VJN71_03665 [Nitrososphaerales archaeon]|nr:hypothetical protein [Nitrososphaerales archaeon]